MSDRDGAPSGNFEPAEREALGERVGRWSAAGFFTILLGAVVGLGQDQSYNYGCEGMKCDRQAKCDLSTHHWMGSACLLNCVTGEYNDSGTGECVKGSCPDGQVVGPYGFCVDVVEPGSCNHDRVCQKGEEVSAACKDDCPASPVPPGQDHAEINVDLMKCDYDSVCEAPDESKSWCNDCRVCGDGECNAGELNYCPADCGYGNVDEVYTPDIAEFVNADNACGLSIGGVPMYMVNGQCQAVCQRGSFINSKGACEKLHGLTNNSCPSGQVPVPYNAGHVTDTYFRCVKKTEADKNSYQCPHRTSDGAILYWNPNTMTCDFTCPPGMARDGKACYACSGAGCWTSYAEEKGCNFNGVCDTSKENPDTCPGDCYANSACDGGGTYSPSQHAVNSRLSGRKMAQTSPIEIMLVPDACGDTYAQKLAWQCKNGIYQTLISSWDMCCENNKCDPGEYPDCQDCKCDLDEKCESGESKTSCADCFPRTGTAGAYQCGSESGPKANACAAAKKCIDKKEKILIYRSPVKSPTGQWMCGLLTEAATTAGAAVAGSLAGCTVSGPAAGACILIGGVAFEAGYRTCEYLATAPKANCLDKNGCDIVCYNYFN